MADALPFHVPVAVAPDNATKPETVLLCVDAQQLAVMLSLGLRTVRAYDASGKLPRSIRIGKRVLWRTDEIREWLAAGAPSRDEWELRRSATRK